MRARLAAVSAVLLLAACGGNSDSASTSAPTDAGSPAVAPYLDIVSGSANISDIYSKTGQASFAAAFVVADSAGSCTPTWGGTTAIDDSTIKATISAITGNGGKVIVATGGETGTYLETACSASELAAAYEKALDAAGSNSLDVDIEQTVTAAIVTSALATLQKARGTAITLTLPVGGEEVGLTDTAIALLTSAKNAGVDVTVNAMTMNFTATGDWGTGLTAATEAVKDDVASVWPDLTDAQVYDMLGVTPMIGVNDTGGTTTLANAKTLLSWAESKGLGFVRFWSVNRDNGGCTDGSVNAACSGIAQDDYAFTSLFKGFTT
ncbi:glycosyl hydrolase [Actinoplanes sp. CA-142083]|uniref:glycosyl hydrolase n=1 Tax=Actinoplanes sp. CA-142083 TaxID=3239903 RepID=UPI003D942909